MKINVEVGARWGDRFLSVLQCVSGRYSGDQDGVGARPDHQRHQESVLHLHEQEGTAEGKGRSASRHSENQTGKRLPTCCVFTTEDLQQELRVHRVFPRKLLQCLRVCEQVEQN